MTYSVRLKRSAEKELARLPSKIHDRVVSVLLKLNDDPLPVGSRKLQGRDGYRIRVGDYRILYTVDERHEKVEIFSVAHRKEVYRM